MPSIEDIFGIAALLLGLVLYLWRNKRRFDRTNAAGIERFPSYGGKVAAKLWDAFLWVLTLSSLTAGVLVLAYAHGSTWGWIVLAPLYAFMLFGFIPGRSK